MIETDAEREVREQAERADALAAYKGVPERPPTKPATLVGQNLPTTIQFERPSHTRPVFGEQPSESSKVPMNRLARRRAAALVRRKK